ncbi:MAG TPA: hypothetical protein VLA43_04890 [Longimicrobiales bacterium]|nr:hypothetical protein [Longimicrobiales bacterium]
MLHRSALNVSLLLAALAPLAACDPTTSPVGPYGPELATAEGPTAAGRVASPGVVQVDLPFRARMYTGLVSLAPDPSCGDPPFFLNTQAGEGEVTHLGRVTVTFTFCVDASDLLDDGRLTEGESLPYHDGVGILVAANGDELHVGIAGAVLPSTDPAYDFQFQDAFTFTGGTGRFQGAEGGGMTDSWVTQATNITDHDLRGRLVLMPGG